MGSQQHLTKRSSKLPVSCGCYDFNMNLNGFETQVGSGGGHHLARSVSGAIARAMLKDAPILILDEAACRSKMKLQFSRSSSFD